MKLLESDEQYLESKRYEYEVEVQGNMLHLIIRNFPFPKAYSVEKADVLIRIPAGYPNSQLDMFWTSPKVSLAGGGIPNRANVDQNFGGKSWQRWSRHWQAPWRPGVDGVDTFIGSIHNELQRGR
jgi:hypothetical protein